MNVNVTAYLAFAGLTWDDVETVEFGGFGDSWTAMVNDQVDAAFASTNSGRTYELEASPRGIHWPPLPHDDKEGWTRLQEVAPFFQPNMATVGAGISEENPYEGGAYPYPVLIAYAEQDPDLVYEMTRAMVELFDAYDGKAPGIGGWALDKQTYDWVVPYHEGAIRYFEEVDVWTDEMQAHTDELLRRQEVLAQTWEQLESQGVADDAWEEAWAEARRTALAEAGFEPVF